jgi:hypothetical protein
MAGVPATLGIEALFAALCLVPGLPLAFALDGRRATPLPALVVDGLVLGLAWLVVVAIVLVRLQHLERRALVAAALFTGFAGWRVARLRRVPFARPWRPPPATLAAFSAVLLVAAVVRADPSYFIYETGDMGEYVNDANQAATGHPLIESFPHGLASVLGASHAMLGLGGTVDILGLVGLALVVIVLGAGRELGVQAAPTAVVGAAVAIGVTPVWYSRFPASESLYASLLAGALYLLLAAHRRDSLALAVAGGLVTFTFGVTRGNVLLVGLPIALYGLVRAASGRREARLDAAFTLAAAAGGAAATLYLLRYNHQYMTIVLPDNVGSAYATLERHGLLVFGVRSVAAAVAVCVGLALAMLACARAAPILRRPSDLVTRAAPLALPALAVLLIALALHPGGLFDAGGRYGVLLLACGALGLASPLVTGSAGARAVLLLIAGIGTAGALLFVRRVPHAIDHAFFLYTDRYLFSETFVATALAALPGAGLAWTFARRSRPTTAVAAVAAATGLVLLVPATRLASRHSEFAGSFGQALALARLTRGAPVLWSGLTPAQRANAFFFPNTFRAYALPLALTWGEPVLNAISLPPFGPDPQLDPAQAIAVARSRGLQRAFLVRERPPAQPKPPPDGSAGTWTYTRVGTSRASIWQLPKRRTSGEERWRVSLLVFDVYRLQPR